MTKPFPAATLGAAPSLAGCAGAGSTPELSSKSAGRIGIPSNGWSPEKQAAHALDRLGYGPLPGEVEAVAKSGVAGWIRGQMAPAHLEDARTEAKLKALPTLSMSVPALFREFPRPQGVAKANGVDVPPEKRPAVLERELAAAKLVRAVESRRQLQEVLVDFWFNHFNVFAGKGADRDGAIRMTRSGPFVFAASAISSARPRRTRRCSSISTTGPPAGGFAGWGLKKLRRELLELHARRRGCTGTTRARGRAVLHGRSSSRCAAGGRQRAAAGLEPGTFVFRPARTIEKSVSDVDSPGRSRRRAGPRPLARHPSTARLSRLLCRRFVSDDPPAAVGAPRGLRAHRRRLPSVYAAIFSAPEFWSDYLAREDEDAARAAASAVRALGGTVDPERGALARHVALMASRLQARRRPDGATPEAHGAGTLVNRLAFGSALAAGRIPGVSGDPARLAPGAADPVAAAALVLGGPDFQKR